MIIYRSTKDRFVEDALDRDIEAVVAAICAAQLVLSPLWLAIFRFGPVEWLWRSLTYAKLQPMRRA